MRILLAAIVGLMSAITVSAHFVYVVPLDDGKSIQVVFSDSLEPDENVSIEKIAHLKLTARAADGKDSLVEHKTAQHALVATVPAKTQIVYGSINYGLLSRKDAKPSLLIYHPKAILSPGDAKSVTLGEKSALEIVPVVAAGKTTFLVLAAGKPVADVELSVLLPNGEKLKLKSDKDGKTEAVTAPGRYALWARQMEAKAGEHDGKKYEEIRHYATLVVDVK